MSSKKGGEMFPREERFKTPESVVPKLKKLSRQLTRDPHTTIYKTEKGRDVVARVVMGRDKIGILDVGFPANDSFSWHIHEPETVVELIMVYEGKLVVELGSGDSIVVCEGEHASIAPRTPHRVRSVDHKVRMVAITVPKEASWPYE